MKKRIVIAMLVGGLMVGLTSGIAMAKEDPAKAACKNGAWQQLVDTKGNAFESQGQCVSYVAQFPDACTELSKPKYDGVYAEQSVKAWFTGDEWPRLELDRSANCPADEYVGGWYQYTDGWGVSWGVRCDLRDSVYFTPGAPAGVHELTWGDSSSTIDGVWSVTCTHKP
ncbi:MAG: hypothetical protein AB1Z67_11475 [Candidatus Limnocylindrales bacterium]